MSDNFTTRNRARKIEAGTRPNTWGPTLNDEVFQLFDDALDGWLNLSANTALTSANGSTDQARKRMIKATAAITITIPSVEKWYWVWASSGDVVVTNGSNSVTVLSGNVAAVLTDGTAISLGVLYDFGATVPRTVTNPTLDDHLTRRAWVVAQIAAAVTGSIPAGADGEFLRTTGSSVDWAEIGIADVDGLTAELAAKENIADRATAAQFRSNADKNLGVNGAWAAGAIVTLTDAATITPDMSTFINAEVTLGGNRTIAAPTNTKVGQSGTIYFIQDGTGSRTATFNSAYKFANGSKTLSTTAGAVDSVHYKVRSSSYIECSLVKAPS